ncbi:MAG: hypothetical protein AAGB26_12745 [Planctomycetota bacterium]
MQLMTRYFLNPVDSSAARLLLGMILAGGMAIAGLGGLVFRVAPMFRSNALASVSGESRVEIVEGTAAIYAGAFWLLLALWLHALECWSASDRLRPFAPIVSNLSLIVGLISGCIAVFI